MMYSCAVQICANLPATLAIKIIQAAGITLDVCFEKLSTSFHALVLEAICPSVSSDDKLSIDGSPEQWSQRSLGGLLPLPGRRYQNRPHVSSRSLIFLFDAMATLSSLSAIHISLSVGRDCDITTPAVSQSFSKALSKLSGLSSLEISDSLAAVAVPAVLDALPHLPRLQRLVAEDGELSPENVSKLAKQLKRLPGLKVLSLAECHMVFRCPKSAASLATAFSCPSLKNLQELNIAGFSSFGGSKVAVSALSALTSLSHLDVENIGLVPDTIPSFTEALKCMPHLQHLGMRYNEVGRRDDNRIPPAREVPESIRLLCTALLTCKELQTVDLSDTHLGCALKGLMECQLVHLLLLCHGF
jgi:hypothetical protein